MNEQIFGTKLFEAASQCINIAGVAHCLTTVDVNEKLSKLWLNAAMCELAELIEQLSDKLTELEEEYHSKGKFKYPCEIDSTHTSDFKYWQHELTCVIK